MEDFSWAILPPDTKDHSGYFVGLSHQSGKSGQIIVSVNNSTTIGVTAKSRSNGSTHSPVVLLGKAVVRDNGHCVAGSWCDCSGGTAIPGTRYNILSRVDTNHIM